jgi:hypothetical protein
MNSWTIVAETVPKAGLVAFCAVDDVLRLGAGGAREADAGRVAAGGRRHVEDRREVAAGAADRDVRTSSILTR